MSPQPEGYDFAKPLLSSQEYFERSTRVLVEADSGFRPREGMMTVAQQVAHVAHTINWFIEGATRPEGFNLDFEKQAQQYLSATSLAAARQKLEAAYANAVRVLRSLRPEQLARPLPGPIMAGQAMSDVVMGIVEHTAHHRGALTVYSRELGKIPQMPYAD